MALSSDVIFIDKQVLLNSFADLGIRGLDAYASRSSKVFVSGELRLELREAVYPSAAFDAISGWLDSLESSGRTVSVDPITEADRARYNPSGKNDAIGGEKFDISVRKYMDQAPAGMLFEVVSDDVGLLTNQHLGQKIVDVNFKPTTLEMEMLDRANHYALSVDEFRVVSARNYAAVPGFQVSEAFPTLGRYRSTLLVHTFDNLLKKSPDALILLAAAPPLMGLLSEYARAQGRDATNIDDLYQMGVELGLKANYETFRDIATQAAAEAGISLVLGPVGMARKAFQLLLSGEDVMDVIKLYEAWYPDEPAIKAVADAARGLEATAAWENYKKGVGTIQSALAWFADTVLGRAQKQAADTAFVEFASGNGAFNTLSDSLSGLAGLVPASLAGTAFASFLPSMLLGANGGLDIAWDWSSARFDNVIFAAPIGGGGFDFISVPGIVVSDTSGQLTGTFAQTSGGIPIWQVAASSFSLSQTATPTADGGLTVSTNNGSVTGQFNYTGPIGADADPMAYFGGGGQLQNFTFTNNATGQTVAEGRVVNGADGTSSNNAVVVTRTRDPAAAAGDPKAWQPVVVRDPWGNEIAGGEIGSILGSSIGNAIAGGNVFGQIAASSVLGTLLQNVGQTFGYALDHNVSLESAAYTTFANFDVELAQQIHSAGIGALTSFLTAELTENLGIHSTDFGGQLFSYAASTGINTILDYAIGNVARARAAAALAHPRQALVPGPARSGSHVGCGAAANDNGAWTYILAA